MNIGIIEIVFLLLGGGLIAVTVLRYLKLPLLLGYLIVGIAVGPHGMELFDSDTDITSLAELGIMAMMFTLGLKFSVARLRSSKRLVLGLGGLQVSVCLGIVTLLAITLFEFDWRTSILIGSIVAMSSTAVVSKLLIERGEVTTPHGTRSISILIFQDLAVIPLIILFSSGDAGTTNIWIELLKAVVLFVVLIVIAPKVMPSVVRFFSQLASSEVFTLFVLCFIIGISLLTYSAGLSLVLGSFVAGMLLSESHHRYLIEEIIRPYSEIFLGFFFVSIGLLVVPAGLLENWPIIVAGTFAVLLFKPVIIFGLTKFMGTHSWTAVYTAVALGGTGEFGFVLLTAASSTMDATIVQILLGINLLCMVSPTLLLPTIELIRARWFGQDWLLQARDLTKIINQASDIAEPVILSGYGQNGKIICRLLDRQSIPWISIENNYERAQVGMQAGKNVVYGDARNAEVLLAAGIANARALVITHGMHAQTVKTTHIAHQLNPELAIIAKTLSSDEEQEVLQAGASHVITAALETGSGLAVRAMQICGLDNNTILSSIYVPQGSISDSESDLLPAVASELFASSQLSNSYGIKEIEIVKDSKIVGLTSDKLIKLLEKTQVKVLYLQRDNQNIQPDATFTLEAKDVLFLEGNSTQLNKVLKKLAVNQE